MLRESLVVGELHELAMSHHPHYQTGETSGLDEELLALKRQLMLLNQYLAMPDHENAGRIAASLQQAPLALGDKSRMCTCERARAGG